MKLVRAADLRPMRWRNGGGETTEVAIHPPGASLDGFDWRVSMARVAADGPFSIFPGIDRTLAVLGGQGFDLAIEGAPTVRLTAASAPHAFPADRAAAARLVDGPADDLNAMTRRGRFSHEVTAVDLVSPMTIAADDVLVAVCGAGQIAAGDTSLDARDALILDPGERADIAPRGATARVLLVAIRAA